MKEDQRIRLSKQLLRNALLELLKEKHISKVSVREICERAQINRTTFYKYYGSQYELLEDNAHDVESDSGPRHLRKEEETSSCRV